MNTTGWIGTQAGSYAHWFVPCEWAGRWKALGNRLLRPVRLRDGALSADRPTLVERLKKQREKQAPPKPAIETSAAAEAAQPDSTAAAEISPRRRRRKRAE